MSHVVIIGSGFAGYELARQIRQHSQDVKLTIITKDDGADYNKPTLSKALGFKMTPELLVSTTAEKMSEKLNASILTHSSVIAIHPEESKISLSQQQIDYDKLVLACGAKVNELNLANTLHVNSLTDYRHFYEAIQHKKHVTIIGAGLVGCELACDLCGAGYQVEVVSIDSRPMPALLPEKLAIALQEKMAAQGIQFHFNSTVNAVTEEKRLMVELASGDTIETDVALSAIGLKPNIELAKQAGIKVNRGILSNEYLETSHANIFALGDCAEIESMLFQHIAPIRHAAMALAKTITGEKTKVIYPPLMYGVKTPYYPLRVCRAPNISNDNWTVEMDDKQNAKATHHNKNGECDAFIFGGERAMDSEAQQALVKTMTNWLD